MNLKKGVNLPQISGNLYVYMIRFMKIEKNKNQEK